MKKKLSELNLLDDFLFGTLMSHPLYGERFYRAAIDSKNLQSGVDYSQLKNVIIIMILSYDPFGCDRMVYTVRNRCVEEPDINYEDGALNLFLYTKGKSGVISQELKELLRYLEDTRWQNAVSESLKEVQSMVDQVKCDKEVSISYMKSYERDRIIRNEGRAEGKIEGLTDGLIESIQELLSNLGSIPENLAAKINSEKDLNTLRHWLRLANKSKSIEEFARQIS